MTPVDLSAAAAAGAAEAPQASPAEVAQRAQIRKAAQEFEALFMEQLIRQMREAQLSEGFFGKGAGSSVYEGMFSTYLADHLSADSPLGIASLLEERWIGKADGAEESAATLSKVATERAARTYQTALSAEASAGGAPSGIAPAHPTRTEPNPAEAQAPAPGSAQAQAPAPAQAAAPAQAPAAAEARSQAPSPGQAQGQGRSNPGVSREYGWGLDPIDGNRKFHQGIDLPSPSGTPVLAVAPGRVVSSETTPGYGLSVVVRHGGGWTTRYAHLSATDVRPGQPLARGQALGRVGSTGRSTGPHLHFEARKEGRQVDPSLAAPGDLRAQVLGAPADELHDRKR